ncbi:MAG: serine hydrolase [Candidatus Marinimicrobia bacterium]|nr:serine hydrolase [Candidatus Neomarinimicrobiota bacterium]
MNEVRVPRLGWGTPGGKSSSGRYFSKNSIGHTSFTGTSIWIDFDKNLAGILLTNRVHPTRDNHKINEYRRKIYDLLQESLTDYPLVKNPNVDY